MNPRNTGKRVLLPHFRAIFLFAATALVAGCNSGGGTPATSTSTSTSTPTAVVITQQNSPQAAGAAYQGVGVAGFSKYTGASTLTGAVVTSGAQWPDLARFAKQQIAVLTSLNYGASSNLVSGAVLAAKNIPCDTPLAGGTPGTFSVSFDDKDNSGTLTTGDTLNATFSNCYSAPPDATTINGGFSLTSLAINGTPSIPLTPWSASATFTLANLRIVDSSGNYTVNGAFSFLGSTTDGVHIKGSLGATSLTIKKATGPTLTLTNFNLTGTTNNNTTAYSEYGSGQVNDPALSGYVNFQIPVTTPFTGIGDQYPSSGSMTVTGANNSSVKLTAIDSTNVQLQVVANGVTYPAVTVPWSKVSP